MNLQIFLSYILIVVGDIALALPSPALRRVETYAFRWTTRKDLTDTNCVTPSTPWHVPNDTLHPDAELSTLHESKIILGSAFSHKDHQDRYYGSNGLFVLIDNPGMIWHPLTGQCVHTNMENISVRGP
ncbi:unnamed protein product, partial [Rotaria sp. Silwood1]